MNTIPLYQADAFSHIPFAGNPAGVALLDKQRPDAWMQSLAAEMNLAETAFLLKEGDRYRLRWFTPRSEVSLCGHATLATAHILWETGRAALKDDLFFSTLSGVLSARKSGDWIDLNFPSRPPITEQIAGIKEVLGGAEVLYSGSYVDDYLVELRSEEEVRSIKPNLALIKKMPKRGLIVTARGTRGEFDFVSRFFAPAIGIDEDPVTGSAHTCLTPYWAQKLGKKEMLAYQASERGGVLKVLLDGSQVIISGQAVTIFEARCFCDD